MVSAPSSSPAPLPDAPLPSAPARDPFCSSGQSPGRATVHLIGPGRVGRAFLRQLGDAPLQVVAVSDASATVFDRRGLDLVALCAHKEAGGRLASLPGAEAIPTALAVRLVAADAVVDAAPSDEAQAAAAVERARAAQQGGAFLALAGKNALAAAPWLLLGAGRGRIGVSAALGGTGRQLVRELDELRRDCTAVALVANVSTTAVIAAIEGGAPLAEGLRSARERGLLEPDPTADLDGSDAAAKLRAVWAALFAAPDGGAPALPDVRRQDLRALDPALLRRRARNGATTRLVARGSRGGDLRVGFEELPLGSPLAAPPDRVVYGYELPGGLRLHLGYAVGHARTAAALLGDVCAGIGAEVAS
jgi:homoserine dehydrogenase